MKTLRICNFTTGEVAETALNNQIGVDALERKLKEWIVSKNHVTKEVVEND